MVVVVVVVVIVVVVVGGYFSAFEIRRLAKDEGTKGVKWVWKEIVKREKIKK